MKTGIHPSYFENVEIRCSCGNVIVAGSTREKMKTELCSNCHPFYTGTQKLVDTAGRVDKFEAKRKKSAQMVLATKQRIEEKKKKPEAYKEKEVPAEVIARAMAQKKPVGKWGAPVGDAPAEMVVKEKAAQAKRAKTKTTKKAQPAAKKSPAAAKKNQKKAKK